MINANVAKRPQSLQHLHFKRKNYTTTSRIKKDRPQTYELNLWFRAVDEHKTKIKTDKENRKKKSNEVMYERVSILTVSASNQRTPQLVDVFKMPVCNNCKKSTPQSKSTHQSGADPEGVTKKPRGKNHEAICIVIIRHHCITRRR